MKLETFTRFLTLGTGQVKGQSFRAVGIHPSSEVDLVEVDGYRLGVGAIVPITGGCSLTPVRRAPQSLTGPGEAQDVGEKLVLQLYEACDELAPPGPRAPVLRAGSVAAASLSAVVGTANLICRLPFQGRRMACVWFKRNTAVADLSLVVVGASYGFRNDGLGDSGLFVEKATETWWNGGGAAPSVVVSVPLAGQLEVRQLYVGGFGDGAEAFDELQFYVFGAGGGGRAELTATAYGECL